MIGAEGGGKGRTRAGAGPIVGQVTTPPQDPYSKGEPSSGPPPQQGAPPVGPPGYGPPGSYGAAGAPTSYGSPGGYGPPPPAWGAPGQGGAPPQTDTKAIVALVLSIGSFVVFPLIPAIVALVLASTSRRDINASGGQLGGAGLVTAAKVISWINIALCVLAVVFLVIVFGVLREVVSEFPPIPTPTPG